MKRALGYLTLALSLVACRGGGDDTTGDDAPDATVNPEDVEIYDIQGGTVAVGTVVNVRGVVVTAIDNYGERKGNIWVAEPAGGAYSGILVYGVDVAVVADLAVGNLVDIETAAVDEFALAEDTSGRTTTELTPPDGGAITVTVVGSGEAPAPEVVDALAIGQMTDAAARDAEWEKWEGVLITLENVSVLSELRQIGSTPQDPPFEEFQVTGPMRVDTSLAAINAVTRDDCLASVTGIGDYFFNYKLLPRATDAIVTGGAGCPAQEEAQLDCEDGLDNEADGFADCADFSCQVLSSCQTETTIVAIQMGQVPDGATVVLNDVVITAVDDVGTSKGFWAADTVTAAPYNGVYVYTGGALPVGTAIGATADITGNVDEFDLQPPGDTLTEINAVNGVVTVTAGTNVATPVTDATATTLAHIADGEPYEGVLVQLTNVKVTATAAGDRLTVTDGAGATIVVDDDAYDYAAATYPVDTTCFATLAGVMTLNVFDDERRLAPRAVTDMVTVGGTCN